MLQRFRMKESEKEPKCLPEVAQQSEIPGASGAPRA
jgi:hypothetical protein